MNIAMSSRIAVRSRTGRPYPFAGRRTAAQRLPFRSMGAGARRCAVLVAGLALLLIAGCGGGADQGPGRVVAVDTSEPVPWHSVDLDRSKAARAIAAAAARRHAELGRLRGVPSVGAALRRARLSGAIGRGAYRRYRAAYDGARGAAARLPGARGVEQRAVLGTVEALADGLALTPSRFPAVFLNLRRNTRTWTQAPFPAAGERRTFGRAPAVFQYVPGQGMQLHPLATWGRINAGLHRCLDRAGAGCGSRALRRQVDGAARLASERGGFRTWEYLYRYAQGTPPWISGMAQATAVQALARARARVPRPALREARAPGARRVRDRPADRRRRAGRRGRRALRHVLVRADDADPQRRAAGGQRAAHGGVADRAAAAPRGSPARATPRSAASSPGSTPAPGRSTRPRARRRPSPTTSSRPASSPRRAGGPASARTATPRAASRATSTSRRGSGSGGSSACGPAMRCRCGSRCRRARRSRSGSTGRAAS